MNTIDALDRIECDGVSFANTNPHWWIGKDETGFWCDYSYCNDPDCDCYQHETALTKSELLDRFQNDEWEIAA